MVGQPGQAAPVAQRLVGGTGPGRHWVLPRQLSGLCRADVRDGQPGAPHPVPQPHAGGGAGLGALWQAHSGRAGAGHGHQLLRRGAGVWSGGPRARRARRLGCVADFLERRELCGVPGLQRRDGAAHRGAASGGLGHHRGLPVLPGTVRGAAAAGGSHRGA